MLKVSSLPAPDRRRRRLHTGEQLRWPSFAGAQRWGLRSVVEPDTAVTVQQEGAHAGSRGGFSPRGVGYTQTSTTRSLRRRAAGTGRADPGRQPHARVSQPVMVRVMACSGLGIAARFDRSHPSAGIRTSIRTRSGSSARAAFTACAVWATAISFSLLVTPIDPTPAPAGLRRSMHVGGLGRPPHRRVGMKPRRLSAPAASDERICWAAGVVSRWGRVVDPESAALSRGRRRAVPGR